MIYLNVEAASVILKEGMSVSTRLDSGMTWYRNIVYKSKGSMVYISLLENYPEKMLTTGSNICLKYVNDYFIYLFEGMVNCICPDEPSHVAIRITSAEEIINSRLSPRYDVCLAADLRPSWDDESYSSIITDISFGGAAFMCKYKFDHNEELNVVIHLPEGDTIHTAAKVIRRDIRNAAIDYSMQFIEFNESNCNILSRFFLLIEDEIMLMYKRFISNVKGRL